MHRKQSVREHIVFQLGQAIISIHDMAVGRQYPQWLFASSLSRRLLRQSQRVLRRTSILELKKNTILWEELTSYKSKTESTGCSWSDLAVLYKTVRRRKPAEVLELGPGVSTLVMAHALWENEKEGYSGRITALEEMEYYFEMARELLPDYLLPFVDFVLTPRVESFYYFFRGVRYQDIPQRPYDFVFVDGPDLRAPSDGVLTFDFDFIEVLGRAENNVYGLVDHRLSTCYVLQSLLGPDKVKFSALYDLGFIGPCTRNDLPVLDLEHLNEVFLSTAQSFGNTKLQLTTYTGEET